MIKAPGYTAVAFITSVGIVVANWLGGSYPAPYDLTSNSSIVPGAWENLTSKFNAATNQSIDVGAPVWNLTFSTNAFSLHDPSASEKFQFHYASPQLLNNNQPGSKSPNGDSIYRAASVSKAFTVYTGLVALKLEDWSRPLTEIFPELGATTSPPGVLNIQWDKITLRHLAAQVGGVSRDAMPFQPSDFVLIDILAASTKGKDPFHLDFTDQGLPQVDYLDPKIMPCVQAITTGVCGNATAFLEGNAWRAPTFLPFDQPAYADEGFELFGMAMSRLLGKPLLEVYQEYLFGPLGLDSSSFAYPGNASMSRYIISSTWATFAGPADFTTSSGGLFTTVNDLAKFGVSILNSTLLTPERTREWLKPISHTAQLWDSVGAPWEIVRYTHANGKVTDIYTKSGDSGDARGYIIVIPDYHAGFSSLGSFAGGNNGTLSIQYVTDAVLTTMIPALEAQARAEAEAKFAGTYSAMNGLNTTITLALNQTDNSLPGLVITEFISNGTDMLGQSPASLGKGPVRVQPTIEDRDTATGSGQVAFRALYPVPQISAAEIAALPPLARQRILNFDWIAADGLGYAGVGLSLLVFDLGGDGVATAVSPEALRVKLQRKA